MARVVTRTCVGCRQRASATELIRVVAVGADTPRVLAPDPRRSAPGRGAHVHPTTTCFDLAERRRAFGRALLLECPVDSARVRRSIVGPDDDPTGSE
ncbi:MAG: YlxR family protein [Nocardioidaceae bacterium]|nr:YlxR family protein [Nocardioidaceae bacterium]